MTQQLIAVLAAAISGGSVAAFVTAAANRRRITAEAVRTDAEAGQRVVKSAETLIQMSTKQVVGLKRELEESERRYERELEAERLERRKLKQQLDRAIRRIDFLESLISSAGMTLPTEPDDPKKGTS